VRPPVDDYVLWISGIGWLLLGLTLAIAFEVGLVVGILIMGGL